MASAMGNILKKGALATLDFCGADRLFRRLNREKLLVVMYHGVTARSYDPPVWTQLPAAVFRRQLAFLREHYRVLSMAELLDAVAGKVPLPQRAAFITFDDGLRNNYSVAFPLLREYRLPATVFLTMEFIGTGEILWFDELYLLMQEGARRGLSLPLPDPQADRLFRAGRWREAYDGCVEAMKLAGERARAALLERLRREAPLEKGPWLEDFGLLDWTQVAEMGRSGQVSFGVHTARHRILAEIGEDELPDEVVAPKAKVAGVPGGWVDCFCFPNGRPGIDYGSSHLKFLTESGYRCAFTTESRLFDWRRGNPMEISRIAAGSDGTSDHSYFRLNASGAFDAVRALLRG